MLTRKQSELAYLFGGSVIVFNILFFAASHFYFADKIVGEGDIQNARIAFAVLSLVIAAIGYAAALWPRPVGHALAGCLAVAAIAGGIAGFVADKPPVMNMTLLVTGAMLPLLAWRSWHHSRAAWSFLVAMMTVFSIVNFFGAPKVNHMLHTGLWYALIIPGLQVVAVISLSTLRGEYR